MYNIGSRGVCTCICKRARFCQHVRVHSCSCIHMYIYTPIYRDTKRSVCVCVFIDVSLLGMCRVWRLNYSSKSQQKHCSADHELCSALFIECVNTVEVRVPAQCRFQYRCCAEPRLDLPDSQTKRLMLRPVCFMSVSAAQCHWPEHSKLLCQSTVLYILLPLPWQAMAAMAVRVLVALLTFAATRGEDIKAAISAEDTCTSGGDCSLELHQLRGMKVAPWLSAVSEALQLSAMRVHLPKLDVYVRHHP